MYCIFFHMYFLCMHLTCIMYVWLDDLILVLGKQDTQKKTFNVQLTLILGQYEQVDIRWLSIWTLLSPNS